MILYGYYRYTFDPTYILVIIGVLLSLAASGLVKNTFNKYSRVRSAGNITGAEAATRLLHAAGIHDVRVEHISGSLTDHYDPSRKILRLSDYVYGSTSVAAIGVAAHETGHAIQHQQKYAPLAIRSALVPLANIGSNLAWPLVIAGLIFSAFDFLIPVGILFFCFAVLFQIVTLPVEFNASARAIKLLEGNGILNSGEIPATKKVLTAAALTYVASAATAILQLLRLVLIAGRRRND